jgi:hypothetical protein
MSFIAKQFQERGQLGRMTVNITDEVVHGMAIRYSPRAGDHVPNEPRRGMMKRLRRTASPRETSRPGRRQMPHLRLRPAHRRRHRPCAED